MYLLGIVREFKGYRVPCGSSTQIQISNKARPKTRLEVAESIMRSDKDIIEVRAVGTITQRMCEMEPYEYGQYIVDNGFLIRERWEQSNDDRR